MKRERIYIFSFFSTPPMKQNCVIYIRVSDQQQTRGSSLADQETTCRAFAEHAGQKVVRVYRDDGKSAWKDDIKHRPQFAQMLASARSGAFQAVIVYKLDRFARKARIYHTCRWQLEQVGVQLVSATEPNEPTAAGRLSSGMLAEFAEFYSAQLLALHHSDMSCTIASSYRARCGCGSFASSWPMIWGRLPLTYPLP